MFLLRADRQRQDAHADWAARNGEYRFLDHANLQLGAKKSVRFRSNQDNRVNVVLSSIVPEPLK